MKTGRNALVRTPLVLVTAVLSAFVAGCSAGVTGLSLLIYDLSTESEDDPKPQTSVSSISPRVGAVIGGYKVTITGKDFGKDALASVGGNGVDPVAGFEVISRKGRTVTAEVTIPFNPVPEPFNENIHAYLGWSDFKWRYTESGLPSALRVSDHGDSEVQFWYFKPGLSRIEGSEDDQTPASACDGVQGFGDDNVFGDLRKVRTLRLEGDYFGFGHPDSHTRVYLLRKYIRDKSGRQQLVAEIPEQSAANDQFEYFWCSRTSGQESDPAKAAHQGRHLLLSMPTQQKLPLLSPGPDYLLRVVNENGVDDIEIGYAPPYPPRSLTCVEAVDGDLAGVKISWSNAPEAGNLEASGDYQNPTGFDFVHIERFRHLEGDWSPVVTVDGDTTEHIDRAAEYTNNAYRVYGDIKGEKSPALTCSLAVIPKSKFDLIWDLSAGEREPGSGEMAEDTSGLLVQKLLEEAGRVTFLCRPERSAGALPPNLVEVLEGTEPRLRTIWITAGEKASFGSLDEKSIEAILRYCKNWDGKLCLEGQHIAAAIEASPSLQAFVCCRLKDPSQFLKPAGSTGNGSPFAGLGSNILGDQLDTEKDERGVVVPVPLTVDLYDENHSSRKLTWLPGADARDMFFALDASEERKDALLQDPMEQIVIGGSSPEGDGSHTQKDFAAALLLSPADASLEQCKCQGACNEKVLISFLSLQGFGPEEGADEGATESQRTTFLRYLEVLEGPPEAPPDGAEIEGFEPQHAVWNSSPTVMISGTHLEKTLEVSFGTTPAKSLEFEGEPPDTKLKVVAPTMNPGSVPLILRWTGGLELVAGRFTFDASDPSVNVVELSPNKGSFKGGTVVLIRGEGFTSPPDLQVFFGEQRAGILESGTDPDGSTFVLVISPPAPPGVTPPFPVSLGVVTSGGSTSATFTYTNDGYVLVSEPRIKTFEPMSGPQSGKDITIEGENFTPDTQVTMVSSCQDPEPGNPDVRSEMPVQAARIVGLGEIQLTVPPTCEGTWHFKVKNVMGSACSEGTYEYVAPEVTEIEGPESGSVSRPGREGTEPSNLFLVRGPRRGFEMTLIGTDFTEHTKVLICGEEATLDPPVGRFPASITLTVPPGTGTCEVALQNPIGQDACAQVPVAQLTYVGRVLFLGQFSFRFDDDNPARGGSNFKAYLESLPDYEHSFLDDPGAGLISAGLLESYDAVVFFKLPGRNLTPAEAENLRDFVKGGGGLVLLGQHGIVNPGIIGLLDAGDADDRNKVLEGSGISFRPDLFCDRSSHILFNGCWTPQQGCVQVGATDDERPPLVGDKDNGVEYPVLRPNPASPHAILQDLEAVLFPWGQTLTVANPKEPNLWALYGSPESWGADSEDVLYSPGDLLCGPWFENGLPQGEEPKGVAGLVALEQGQGRIVAVGDQDMFTNHYFVPTFCLEQDGVISLLQSELLFKNILDWVTGKTDQ